MTALLRWCRRLAADRRGTTAVEFVLLLPLLLLLTATVIETGLILATDASLEMAVRNASRYGITGAGGSNRNANIYSAADKVMHRWLGSKGTLTVDTKVYNNFDNIGKPEPFTDKNDNLIYDDGDEFDVNTQDLNKNGKWDSDQGTSDAGGSGAIVNYTITVTRPTFTGAFGLAGITSLTFVRQMAVVNE